MNYSGIEWTKKTGITQTDLNIMDAGIKAASKEINDINASVIALKNANIQRGYYVFAKNTAVNENKVAEATVTTLNNFSGDVTIVATVNTARPDSYRVSVSRIKESNNTFSTNTFKIYLHTSDIALSDGKMKSDIAVHWIIIN